MIVATERKKDKNEVGPLNPGGCHVDDTTLFPGTDLKRRVVDFVYILPFWKLTENYNRK